MIAIWKAKKPEIGGHYAPKWPITLGRRLSLQKINMKLEKGPFVDYCPLLKGPVSGSMLVFSVVYYEYGSPNIDPK